MENKINFGPYASWENIKAFSGISEKAFSIFYSLVKDKGKLLLEPINHLFYRMAYQADMTSLSIRIINSWALNLPAFALVRVRLEQTIICSYLIYEDISIGLANFIKYMAIQRYKGMKVAMEDKTLKHFLKEFKNLDKLKEDAIKAQQESIPEFSYDQDKFERKWTKLDLRSIAKKRDSLVPKEPLIKHPLEREYLSIYKVASSIVHADCDSLSHNFIDFFPSPDGSPVLMPIPTYALIIALFTARYDILQCHEILNRVGISPGDQYVDLMDELFKLRDKYMEK